MKMLSTEQLELLSGNQALLMTQNKATRREVGKLDTFIGAKARRIIASSSQATPFLVESRVDEDFQGKSIRGFKVIEEGKQVKGKQLLKLKSIILNQEHHTEINRPMIDCCASANIAIRFYSAKTLSILISQEKSTWCISEGGTFSYADSKFELVKNELNEILETMLPN